MVHKRIVAQTIIAIAVSCLLNTANVSLAAQKVEEGFVSLFNGKTLDGWHLMNGAKFVVEDGVIKQPARAFPAKNSGKMRSKSPRKHYAVQRAKGYWKGSLGFWVLLSRLRSMRSNNLPSRLHFCGNSLPAFPRWRSSTIDCRYR